MEFEIFRDLMVAQEDLWVESRVVNLSKKIKKSIDIQ